MLHTLSSGVKHLEEIREAGYETPTVNQIEVGRGLSVDRTARN